MLVERVSPLTGRHHTKDLPITAEQLATWASGVLLQDAVPHLSAADREFLKTGITPEEWEAVFGPEEEEE